MLNIALNERKPTEKGYYLCANENHLAELVFVTTGEDLEMSKQYHSVLYVVVYIGMIRKGYTRRLSSFNRKYWSLAFEIEDGFHERG